MKKIIFLIILSLFFVLALLDHDNNGVAYNPLFHQHGNESDDTISMPCGLGGATNHNH